jgi:hypothetical protein
MKFKMPKHPFSKKPPKALKDAVKMTLQLQDEIPRVGSGYRTVWAKVSRKWTYVCDSMGNRAKLPTIRFNQLTRSARYE